MEYTEFIIRILITVFLSFLVGLERQWRRRSIGLRTNVLVCLGSFLFASLPVMLGVSDMKVAAQVVSGIGFLGAGVILKDGVNIRGLNTAATLWCNAAIGLLCAYGLLLEAIIGTVLILMSNIVLRRITRKLLDRAKYDKNYYVIRLIVIKEKELALRTLLINNLKEENINLSNMDVTSIEDGKKTEIELHLSTENNNENIFDELINRFSIEPGVTYIAYSLDKNKDSLLDDDN